MDIKSNNNTMPGSNVTVDEVAPDIIATDSVPNNGSDSTSLIELSELRISQDYAEIGITKSTVTVPVRKPNKQDFVRTHPNEEEYWLPTWVLNYDDDNDRTTYLVAPSLRQEIASELTPMMLIASISRQGVLFLWPIRLPDEDGKHNSWCQSALIGARMAKDSWVRVKSNRALGAYELHAASGDLEAPQWPDLTLEEIVQTAFKDAYIDSPDHHILKRLRGVE